MTKAYIVNVSDLDIEKAQEQVCEERKKRALRYRQLKSRQQSFGSWLLLQHTLHELGVKMGKVSYNEHGKPFLPGIHFNISHSWPYAAVVISDQPCGIDIEEIGTDMMAVAKRFFSEKEAELCAGNPEHFFKLWTLKESILKLLGTGLSRELNSIDFAENIDTGEFQKRIDGTTIYFYSERYADTHWLTVSGRGPLEGIENCSTSQIIGL